MNKLTCNQWYILCYLSLQFTVQLRMFIPGYRFEAGSYLTATAIAVPLIFISSIPSFALMRKEPKILAPDEGAVVFRVIYGFAALLYAVLTLAQFTLFLRLTFYVNTSPVIMCAAVAVAAFTAVINGIGQLGRMGLLFGAYFAAVFVIFSLSSSGNIDFSKIPPPGENGIQSIIRPTAMQLFGASELSLLVWGGRFCDTSRKKPFAAFLLLSAATSIIANFVFISPLGVSADKFVFPFYNGLQTSGSLTFQRPDIFYLTVWSLLAVTRLSLWLYAACDMLTPPKYNMKAVPKIIGAAVVFASAVFLVYEPDVFLTVRSLLNKGVLFIPAVIILPLAALAASAVRRKKKCGN